MHVGLRSQNLERTRKFYREILGLKEELRHSGIVFVPVGHDSLVLYDETFGTSAFHIGFEVATSREVDRWRDLLRSKDVPIHDDISEGGYLSFKIRDPDGHWVEIPQKNAQPRHGQNYRRAHSVRRKEFELAFAPTHEGWI